MFGSLDMPAGAAHRHGFLGRCNLMHDMVFLEATGSPQSWCTVKAVCTPYTECRLPLVLTATRKAGLHTTHLLAPLPGH